MEIQFKTGLKKQTMCYKMRKAQKSKCKTKSYCKLKKIYCKLSETFKQFQKIIIDKGALCQMVNVLDSEMSQLDNVNVQLYAKCMFSICLRISQINYALNVRDR